MWEFAVHTVVLPRMNVIRDMTVCECTIGFPHFKGSRCLHPQDSSSPMHFVTVGMVSHFSKDHVAFIHNTQTVQQEQPPGPFRAT